MVNNNFFTNINIDKKSLRVNYNPLTPNPQCFIFVYRFWIVVTALR